MRTSEKIVLLKKAEKRFQRKLKWKKRQKSKRRRKIQRNKWVVRYFDDHDVYEKQTFKWLPPNLSYLINNTKSDFHHSKLRNNIPKNNGVFLVPVEFSIVDYPEIAFNFLQQLTGVLLFQSYSIVEINYSKCVRVDLGAQVLLDLIIKDVITFYKKLRRQSLTTRIKQLNGTNVKDEEIKKLLHSVGSFAIHGNRARSFSDIIPYPLCIRDRESSNDAIKISEKKDIDTTTLVDYVIDSLKRLGKTLTPDKLDDLCTVIGEILINAEEHSTTKYRFSIGYFHEKTDDNKHFGVFRLVILNFGKTIYEKFRDPNCPNQTVVDRMKVLSDSYKLRNIFSKHKFEEETLWTLYALQEGVTSIAPEEYRKRGNGSIQFIDSFFNIKEDNVADKYSRMCIQSGNAMILFDGEYNIQKKEKNGEMFRVMTFNDSGDIEVKPDSKYVKFVENYFPGTIISARILFNEDN